MRTAKDASSLFTAKGAGIEVGGRRDLDQHSSRLLSEGVDNECTNSHAETSEPAEKEGASSTLRVLEAGRSIPAKQEPPSAVTSEMMFLVIQMLRASPCHQAAQVLEDEAQRQGLFGETRTWTGAVRQRSAEDIARMAPHITHTHLLRLVSAGVSAQGPPHAQEPGPGSLLSKLNAVKQHVSSMIASTMVRNPIRRTTNEVALQRAKEMGLRVAPSSSWRPYMYDRIDGRRSLMGHFLPIYCFTFDRTGLRFITGSDDKLIKMWSTRTHRLCLSLRGHISDIVDLAVSVDNRFLASASNDSDIRIWWMHNGHPALVLPGHLGVISRISFTPTLNADLSHSLVSAGHDGSTRVWRFDSAGALLNTTAYTTDEAPTRNASRRENVGVLSVCISPTGQYIATGSCDKMIRIYSTLPGRTRHLARYIHVPPPPRPPTVAASPAPPIFLISICIWMSMLSFFC
jgi:hypothetical protein